MGIHHYEVNTAFSFLVTFSLYYKEKVTSNDNNSAKVQLICTFAVL